MSFRFSLLITATSLGILSACASSVAEEATAPQADDHNSERHFVMRHGGRGGHHMHKMIFSADDDGDGRVSKEEFMAKHDGKFAEMDANDDGFITDDEFKEFSSSRRQSRHHNSYSYSYSSDMTEAERQEFEAEMQELEIEMEALGKEMGELGSELSNAIVHSMRWRTGDGDEMVISGDTGDIEDRIAAHKDKVFEKMDTNGDGKISQEEFTGRDSRFARMDKNEDGFISREELKVKIHITRELDGFPPRMQEKIIIKEHEED